MVHNVPRLFIDLGLKILDRTEPRFSLPGSLFPPPKPRFENKLLLVPDPWPGSDPLAFRDPPEAGKSILRVDPNFRILALVASDAGTVSIACIALVSLTAFTTSESVISLVSAYLGRIWILIQTKPLQTKNSKQIAILSNAFANS